MPDMNLTPVAPPSDVPMPAETPATTPPAPKKDDLTSDIEKRLAKDVKDAKAHRRTFFHVWKRNIEMRLGKPEGGMSVDATTDAVTEAVDDEFRSEINPDWAFTKAKTAVLYSQVPTVRGTHQNKQYAAAIGPFMKELNYQLGEKRADVGVAMNEELNDIVNASGIGGILVGYTARFEDKLDPQVAQEVAAAGYPQDVIDQMVADKRLPTIPIPVSDLFFTLRLSPTDLLLPKTFKGSDYNKGPWVGYTGEKFWAEAEAEWELDPAKKSDYLSGKENRSEDDMRVNFDREHDEDEEKVYYDHVFYRRYLYDPAEKNMSAIWEIIYVHGVAEPIVHGPCKCQKLIPGTNEYVGSCKYPLQVATLTYVTDNPIPPSDSEAGRPQVNDLRRSRSQMFANRARSTPLRWYDVNRVNKDVQMMLMRGDIQGFIPTNGPGDKAIGELARANYPAEDLSFDRQTMQDLERTWQIGANQMGIMPPGERTKGEVEQTQANFATRIGQERAAIAKHFLNIAEVMAGYIALYSDFKSLTPEERQGMMNAWDSRRVLHDLVLTIRPDSTVLLDSNQRLSSLERFLNMTVKSGFVNPLPILTEMAELSGLDPSEVIVPPQPKDDKADKPNISYRFSGKDDLMNPMVVAMLIKEQLAPSPQELEAAKNMLASATEPPRPAMPMGALGQPQPMPGPQGPQAAPAGGSNAHQGWNLASKIAQRSEDVGIQEG